MTVLHHSFTIYMIFDAELSTMYSQIYIHDQLMETSLNVRTIVAELLKIYFSYRLGDPLIILIGSGPPF